MADTRIHLSDADLDAWRQDLLFGAYAPDPDRTPPVDPAPPIPADAPAPPIQVIHRRPEPAIQAVRGVLAAIVLVLALAQLAAWVA